MKYYQSIDTLPIKLFNKIHETGDLRYLIKVGDYEYLPDKKPKELEDIWPIIEYEYYQEIESTRKRNVDLDTTKHIMRLQIDRHAIKLLCLMFILDPKADSCMAKLAAKGYKIDRKNIDTLSKRLIQVNEIDRRLKVYDTKIAVLNREIKDHTQQQKDTDVTFEDIVMIAEKSLGRDIDLMKTSVKKWIHIENHLLKSNKHGKDKE